jgi:Tfp pilus assembly protein FimT
LLEAFDMRRLSLFARERGASVIETLVATVLGLLVLVLSSRSVLAVAVGESRQGGARPLLESVQFARAEAAQRHSPVAICGLDPQDAQAAPGLVHCAAPGTPWQAGWIVYGDDNLNGQLDDGEAVLRVVRDSHPIVFPDGEFATSSVITFRPMGTLASAAPRRLLVSADSAAAPTHAICVAIEGFAAVMPIASACR